MQPLPDCPYCHCLDVRPLTGEGADLLGFRCHDCQRTFYVTSQRETADADDGVGRVDIERTGQARKVK